MKNFWPALSHFILKNRLPLLLALAATTAFMGYEATKIRLSYELVKILPASDPNFKLYEAFKKRYGEDGNVMVIGVETDRMYQLNFFRDWYALSNRIKAQAGIKDVVSNASLYEVFRNDSLRRFDFRPVLNGVPTTQAGVDSLRNTLARLPFYSGFIFNETAAGTPGNAHLMAVTFDPRALNDRSRIDIVLRIRELVEQFEQAHGTDLHLSGMPYIRTQFMKTVSSEMQLFTLLAVGVTALILLLFFRSFNAVFFSIVVVLIGCVFSVGLLVLLGYRITILSGLIPPLLIVIGIPNSIFLLNKYHEEYAKTRNQTQALSIAVEKIGYTTFLANLMTAIGFGVFAFTGSNMLVEFGLVASSSVLLTFLISLIFIPGVFSYLPPPSDKHVARLENKRLTAVLGFIDRLVHTRRGVIYAVVAALMAVSLYGTLKVTAIGYVVDDLPADSPVLADLKFFEQRFRGVLPFEVSIDAQRPGRVLSPPVLNKIRRMEKEVATYGEFTDPLSIVRAIKFLYQSYRGGDPKYYVVPPLPEIGKMQRYQTSLGRGTGQRYAAFLDSTQRYARVSFQMADVGTVRTRQLVDALQPKIDTIFNWDAEAGRWAAPADRYDAHITGSSVVFMRGNEYLQKSLIESTAWAVLLICLVRALLFFDVRLILISTLPSLIPLLMTAGLMGYFGISLKPSTILIFSIAFGIASDGTIYFLTRYKDELMQGKRVPEAITQTIMHTGVSMFYTAVILFFGFFIFAASTFKGTQSLGILISVTLLVAMIANLVLLPALLMDLNNRREAKTGSVVSQPEAGR